MLVVIHDAESDQLSVYIVNVWQNIFPKRRLKLVANHAYRAISSMLFLSIDFRMFSEDLNFHSATFSTSYFPISSP